MNTREIKTKKPWKRIKPQWYMSHGNVASFNDATIPVDNLQHNTVTQADFLREYFPSGHVINDPMVYPNIFRAEEYTDDNGVKHTQYYEEHVPRFAFAFQQIIATKQLVHLCGNDVQCELDIPNPSQTQIDDYNTIKKGWLEKDMEIAFYEGAKAVKTVADGAIVGYIHNGKFGYKSLSYTNGDILYPHFDSITGELILFGRCYTDYDDEGNFQTEWLEVWDKYNLTRYKRSLKKGKSVKSLILGLFNLEGYTMVGKPQPHGFPFIPVAYNRSDEGPCWSPSQDSIEGYEMSFSQMAHNNQAYGEPILYMRGESVEMQHDINGTIKSMTMGTDDEAGYLASQSASESYMKQLDVLYKMIYEQSFTVIPPELRSGDLPAAALKILYSPAYEKAVCDCMEYQPFLNQLVRIFTYGYGVEMKKTIDFTNLPLKWWLKPYVHINETAVVTDLATAVQNGFISKQTASERIPFYSTASEWERIMKEYKQQQQADLLYEMQTIKATQSAKGNSSGNNE